MKTVTILDYDKAQIPGVRFACKEKDGQVIAKDHFKATILPLQTEMTPGRVICNILEGPAAQPAFSSWETHTYWENFYYYHGTALMPFIQIVDGKADPDTVQIVRIPAGVQVEVAPGVGHYVATAETDYFTGIVCRPDAGGSYYTTEPVLGIK